MLTQRGFPADVVEAVLSARFDDPLDAMARVEALTALKTQAGFEPLAVAFKRVGNIIKGGVDTPLRHELLEADCERTLADAVTLAKAAAANAVAAGDYAAALQAIAALRVPVDAFFEGVMVMAEQPETRGNRLALLTQVGRLFDGIADFAKIAA
jgi:glycyl-tRNA synthetase beta chain